jgi:hypothetical protein
MCGGWHELSELSHSSYGDDVKGMARLSSKEIL